MRFTGVRRDGWARVYCNGKVLRLPMIRESGWNREARHSPTGFEWGYNGSGPAELARAILMRVFPHDRAVREPRVYQAFKFQIVSCLPREAFSLTDSEVRAWRAVFDAPAATSSTVGSGGSDAKAQDPHGASGPPS